MILVAAGWLLRLSGLNHDLAEGYNYHPDAAKHLRAAEWFVQGQYFIRLGIHDWDGYPLLNSHLIELVIRAYVVVVQVAADLLGIHTTIAPPRYETNAYFWIARVLNATISASAIVVADRVGRRAFGTAAGLVAATLLAVSPLDIVACHYEAAESTTACAAAIAVLFALRVLESGRLRDYAATAFFVAASFAAKYHGAMAVAPLAVAHVLHWRARDGVLSRRALARIAWTFGAAVPSALVVMPALGSHPVEAIADILSYSRYLWESTVQRIPELADKGFFAREWYSISTQGPILAAGLSPFGIAAIAIGLPALTRRREAAAVLAAMPLLYLGIGIGFRPVVQPVYHTLITIPIFVLVAAVVTAPRAPVWRVAHVAIALACLASLGRVTLRELYFFRHEDAQRLGTEWAAENVPEGFARVLGDYTIFDLPRSKPLPLPFEGTLFASGTIRPAPVPSEAVRVASIAIEPETPLPVFRNPTYDLFLLAPGLDEARFRIPPLSPRASRFASDFSTVGVPSLLRSDAILEVRAGEIASRTFVSAAPLAEARLVVRNGPRGTAVELSFGGERRELLLAPGDARLVTIPHPRSSFPGSRGHELIPLEARSSRGPVSIRVTTDAGAAGWELFRALREADAATAPPLLAAAARTSGDPLLAGAAVASLLSAGKAPDSGLAKLAAPLSGPLDRSAYGGAIDYLERLSYFEAVAARTPATGFETIDDDEPVRPRREATRVPFAAPEVRFDLPFFAPGRYEAALAVDVPPGHEGGLDASVVELDGPTRRHTVSRVPVPLLGMGPTPLRFRFEIPDTRAARVLAIGTVPGSRVSLGSLSIRPDFAAEWSGLGNLIRALGGDRDAGNAVGPADHGAVVRSMAHAAPRADAARRVPLAAEFQGGLELDSYRLREQTVMAGTTIHFAPYFTGALGSDLDDATLWIHFQDESGRIAFVGDTPLLDAIGFDPDSHEPVAPGLAIDVPSTVPPGRYAIRLGVTREGKSLAVRSARAAIVGRGVMLADTLVVTGG